MTSASVFAHYLTALLLLVSATSSAHGQQRARGSARCDGRVIREIRVSALRPPFKGEAAYWRRVARSIGLHHATTDTAVVRRFLALQTGGTCTEFRMRESARLLREQPFLADASVRSIPDDSGGVRIEVETTDEIPALASASIGGGKVAYLEIGNENMFGDAWLLAIHGADRDLEGRSAGFRVSDFQFLGRQYQLDVQGDWGQRTSGWLIDAFHAYQTDLQRIAWQAGVGHAPQEFIVVHRGKDIDDLGLRYQRSQADVGGVFKLGKLRTPVLVGSVLNFFRLEPRGGVAVNGSNVVPDTTLASRYPKVSRSRLSGVGAWRNLNFITARGFDALTATQDLATGFQLFGQLGRGTHSFGGSSDVFMLADVLSGVGSGKSYVELHLISEGRREIGQTNWDGIVTTGRLGLYFKPNELSVLRGWSEYAGGWRVQWPYQLALATEGERLIGYKGSIYGGRRVGGGIEGRRVLPNVNSRADVGVGVFVHAARLWAGDVPFGVDTPLLPSAGISLFGAIPRGSQRLLRIDLGTALRRVTPKAGWEVRLSYGDVTRRIRDEPRDIQMAREQLVGPDVFRP